MKMQRFHGLLAFVLLTLAATSEARAQWYYPYGYGGYGWGGWNSIGNVYGSYARGLGWYAVGQGIYNLDTAQARSINVNTNMRLNEYLYESLLQHDRRLWAAKQRDLKAANAAIARTQDRLRNAPTPEDISSGDALNVALTELTDPRYSYQVSMVARDIPLSADVVKQIPFRNAVEAITISLNELTDGDLPAVFEKPEFAEGVKKYRALIDELDKEAEENGKVKVETVREFRKLLQDANAKIQGMQGLDDAQKFEAERYVRTLLGLSYMLDGPSLDVFLAGVEEAKDLSLAKLLVFMQSFNLRFGSADNPNQRQVMQQVYEALVKTRAEVFGEGTGTLPTNAPTLADRTTRPSEFFSGMRTNELDPEANRTKATSGK